MTVHALNPRETLTLADASRMMREAVKDRSYRATPLGLEVARYYRWKKNKQVYKQHPQSMLLDERYANRTKPA